MYHGWYREKAADLPSDVVNALFFLEEFIHYGQMPRKVMVIGIGSCDPPYHTGGRTTCTILFV